MIRLIGQRETLDRIFLEEGTKMLSYVNLNSYKTLVDREDLHGFCYTVDSSSLARYLDCDALMPDFSGYIGDAISMSRKVLCLGGRSAEAENFRDVIASRYPYVSFQVLDGFMHNDIYTQTFISWQPDLVICSMGYPLQEELVLSLKDAKRMDFDCIFLCAGAFISQTSKNSKGYPEIVVKLNLRWFYRLLNERTARHRAWKILRNYIKLYGKEGDCFRHSIRFQ